jgi:hypothetical protein
MGGIGEQNGRNKRAVKLDLVSLARPEAAPARAHTGHVSVVISAKNSRSGTNAEAALAVRFTAMSLTVD